jgi:protein O-GlcNAc transferase
MCARQSAGSAMRPIAQIIDEAIAAFRAGALDDAAALAEAALRGQPRNVLALRLAADIALARQDAAAAAALLKKAVKLAPADGQLHGSLALALQQTDALVEARVHHQRATALCPDDPAVLANRALFDLEQGDTAGALSGLLRAHARAPDQPRIALALANALAGANRLSEAERLLAQTQQRFPGLHEIRVNRADLQIRLKRFDAAEQLLRGVLAERPELVALHLNLALALEGGGRCDEAVAHCRQAIAAMPDLVDAHNGLANALRAAGRNDEAIGSYRDALARDASRPELHCNLGRLLLDCNRCDEAEVAFRAALAVGPEFVPAWAGLAEALAGLCRMDDALAAWREAARLSPGYAERQGAPLLLLSYGSRLSPHAVRAEHEAWAAATLASASLCALPRRASPSVPERRLRVGYVSPDFYQHPVAFFIEPVLAAHERARIEVHAYFTGSRRDAVTERLRGAVEHWHDVAALDDGDLFACIAADEIDVLIDLAGHTQEGRLPVFALKPAAVQVTWIGYPTTTGLRQIDYRITDAVADPPGESDAHCVEALWRLAPVFCCYRPEPAPLPPRAPSGTPITFGCYNNPKKLSDATLQAWSRVLARVPDARLALKGVGLEHAGPRAALQARLRAHGVDPARVDIRGWHTSREEHLASYGAIDITLDPFPYNGTTTTLESLWMGVPVITLAGDRHVARVGATLLAGAGLPELVAIGVDEYVDRVVALAEDRERLAALHRSVRDRLERSPLLDAVAFTRRLEAAYREMYAHAARPA